MPGTYNPLEQYNLDHKITVLCDECSQVQDDLDLNSGAAESILRFKRYKLIAQKCTDFLVELRKKHESCGVMLQHPHSRQWQGISEVIIPFAMSLESEDFTDLSNWIGSTWLSLDPQVFSPDQTLHKTRSLVQSLDCFYASDVDGYRAPAFYVNGIFRNANFHLGAIPQAVEDALDNIIDTSRHNPSSTIEWVKKIHALYIEDPGAADAIKNQLAAKLVKVSVDGLDDLRNYILGQGAAKAVECSLHRERIVSSITGIKPAYPFELDAFVVASNKRYVRDGFVIELVDQLNKIFHEGFSTAGEKPFETGRQCSADLARLYTILGLDTDDLCQIAMMFFSQFSLGARLDLEDEAPIDRMRAVFSLKNSYRVSNVDVNGSLRHAVLGSVIQALPDELVETLALDSEAIHLQIQALSQFGKEPKPAVKMSHDLGR